MSMEYLKSVRVINNNNNFTKFKVITSNRELILLLPYTVIKENNTKDKYYYKDSIISKISKLGIYTGAYF